MWARQLAEGAVDLISTPEGRWEAGVLLATLRKLEGNERAKIAALQKSIQRERLEGSLLHMKDRLEEARQQKRAPQDIRSIEAEIQRLEKDASALR